MAAFTRMETFHKIMAHPLVPDFFHPEITICRRVAEACYEGGARVFSFSAAGEAPWQVFAGLIPSLRNDFPDMAVGAGGITDASAAALYIQAGADFIASPVVNGDMARVCNRRKVAWLPSAATATETGLAEEFGAELVLMPAGQVPGPPALASIRSSLPASALMVSGDVAAHADGLLPWFRAGAAGVFLGSGLFSGRVQGRAAFDEISRILRDCFGICAAYR